MIYPPNSPCMVCHDKGDWQKKAKLQRMELLCSSLSESAEIRHSPDMGLRVHSRCRYGLSCTALTSFDNECNLMARQLSGKLAAAAVSEDDSVYHELLELCRGDFPACYRELEFIHNKYRKTLATD